MRARFSESVPGTSRTNDEATGRILVTLNEQNPARRASVETGDVAKNVENTAITVNVKVSPRMAQKLGSGTIMETAHDLRDRLSERIEQSSQSRVAQDLGFSRSFVNGVLLGRDPISPAFAERLGYVPITVYLVRPVQDWVSSVLDGVDPDHASPFALLRDGGAE